VGQSRVTDFVTEVTGRMPGLFSPYKKRVDSGMVEVNVFAIRCDLGKPMKAIQGINIRAN